MKKLSIEHPFFEFMGNIGDWIILNVLFVITSLPIITIGMSATAMYRIALRRIRGENRYVAREYFQVLCEEWKKSTGLWIFFLTTGGLLLFDVLYGENLWKALNIGVGCLVVLWCFAVSYAFPLQARFENSIRNTLINALVLAFRNLPATLVMVLLNSIPALCIASGPYVTLVAVSIYCIFGFSLTAAVNSLFLNRIFRKFMERMETVNGKDE